MVNKFARNANIDAYVDELASHNFIKSFYPIAISKELNIPLTPVIERLNRLVLDEILILKYEIKCNECIHTIDIVDDYSKYVGNEVSCKFCDEICNVGFDNIIPIYYISNKYKEFIKKKVSLKKKSLISTNKLHLMRV